MTLLLPGLVPVEVLSSAGGWCYIRLPDGTTTNVRSVMLRSEEAQKTVHKIKVPVKLRRVPRSDEDPSAA